MTDYAYGGGGGTSPWSSTQIRNAITDVVINAPNLTNISKCAFLNNISLRNINLPNSLTTIGQQAFQGCTNLVLSKLPSNVTRINTMAFDGCTSLASTFYIYSSPTLESSVFGTSSTNTSVRTIINLGTTDWSGQTGVGQYITVMNATATGTCGTNLNWAYVGDNTTLYIYGSGTRMTDFSVTGAPWGTYRTSITGIVFDAPNLENIGNSAFYNCSNLLLNSLPEGVTKIGNNSFYNCAKITLAELPDGVISIGSLAFYGCSKITISSLPNGVISIGNTAFQNCSSLRQMYIPSSVTTLGNGAFANSALQHIEYDIPNYTGTWSSGNFPFSGCTGIVDVTIGENVESLPNYLFYENSAVTTWTTINWNAVDCADFSQDNMIFHNDKIHTIIFGDSVKHVPAYLTREFNDTLESVSFNDGLESIGDGAFQNSAIVVLGLPSTVKSVGVWSFSNCPNVMIRTLPTNMESIGSNAFANCSGITEMLIPVGFSATINDGAFANDTNLKTVLNLSNLDIQKGATTYGSIGAYADEVRNDIPSIGIVQQKDHIVHETIEKTDMASTLLRILPALMVIAILSFIVGALYYRSRDLNE